VSGVAVEDAGHQTSVFGDDHKEREEVLYVRGPGEGRQRSSAAVSSLELSVDDEGEAVHLHDADAIGRRLEPDPVQFS